jgi:molybdate transport system substrate-binding protein
MSLMRQRGKNVFRACASGFAFQNQVLTRKIAMRMRVLAGSAVVLALVGMVWLAQRRPPHSEGPGERVLSVAAASDLKFALDDLLAVFRRQHPDIQVRVTYGSSGNFFAQLNNRAPFDLFLSADMDYPRRLVAAGLAAEQDAFVYAVGHLVLWVPRSSSLEVEKLGLQTLRDASVRKIAIANPRHAPYGRAAEAALKTARLDDDVRDRLVLGENVAQTAQFVQTGAADVGIIALSLALAPALTEEGRYWEIPSDTFPRLEQGGVILSWAQDPEAAARLRAFIMNAEGKAVLRRYGFFLPGE